MTNKPTPPSSPARPSAAAPLLDVLERLAEAYDAVADGQSMTDTPLWWTATGTACALRQAATVIARGWDRARQTYRDDDPVARMQAAVKENSR